MPLQLESRRSGCEEREREELAEAITSILQPPSLNRHHIHPNKPAEGIEVTLSVAECLRRWREALNWTSSSIAGEMGRSRFWTSARVRASR